MFLDYAGVGFAALRRPRMCMTYATLEVRNDARSGSEFGKWVGHPCPQRVSDTPAGSPLNCPDCSRLVVAAVAEGEPWSVTDRSCEIVRGVPTRGAAKRAGRGRQVVPRPPQKREAIEEALRHFGLT
jgi:hypothetical protein